MFPAHSRKNNVASFARSSQFGGRSTPLRLKQTHYVGGNCLRAPSPLNQQPAFESHGAAVDDRDLRRLAQLIVEQQRQQQFTPASQRPTPSPLLPPTPFPPHFPLFPPPPPSFFMSPMMPMFPPPPGFNPNGQMPAPDPYKTVLCQAWLNNQRCDYGENCRYAHGEAELLLISRFGEPQTNGKYKTKLCDKYTLTGTCRYGSRCLFIHSDRREGGPHQLQMKAKKEESLSPVSGTSSVTSPLSSLSPQSLVGRSPPASWPISFASSQASPTGTDDEFDGDKNEWDAMLSNGEFCSTMEDGEQEKENACTGDFDPFQAASFADNLAREMAMQFFNRNI